MPAPAVYVLAVVGTVGAVLAFKEFVYPHIAPAIDKWYIEYQSARRRRQRRGTAVAVAHESEDDVLMSQTTEKVRKARKPESGPRNSIVTETSSSDDEGSSSGVHGNRFMKGGLLLRRPPEQRGYERLHDSSPSSHQSGIELDDLVAREVRDPTATSFPNQTLRQRNTTNASVARQAMDESIHTIPYTPMSPSRTHVVFDSSSSPVSTPTSSGSRASSPPLPPLPTEAPSTQAQPHPLSFSIISEDVGQTSSRVHPQVGSRPASSLAHGPQALPPLAATLPSPRLGSPFQQSIEQSPLFSKFPPSIHGNPPPTLSVPTSNDISYPTPSTSLAPTAVNAGSTPASSVNTPSSESRINLISSSIYNRSIPSLSQSYPQELEYEHGLELLSPPSSRSMSPFSTASLSPNLSVGAGSANGHGMRILSPSSAASSAFSSAISSPALPSGRSPLAMELGNDSYDAVSPAAQSRVLGTAHSPFHAPASISASNSGRSTTYLSFDEESASERGSPIQYPRLPLQPQPHPSQPASPSRATPCGPAFDMRNSGSLLFMNDSLASSSQTQTPTHGTVLTPHASLVASNFRSPLVPRDQPPAPSPHRSPQTDTLSDLDFLSESSTSEFEYAMSEPSDLGNESAGEGRPRSDGGFSETGSDEWNMPAAPTGAPDARREDNMSTVRGRRTFG